jgi:hypothetical protein
MLKINIFFKNLYLFAGYIVYSKKVNVVNDDNVNNQMLKSVRTYHECLFKHSDYKNEVVCNITSFYEMR